DEHERVVLLQAGDELPAQSRAQRAMQPERGLQRHVDAAAIERRLHGLVAREGDVLEADALLREDLATDGEQRNQAGLRLGRTGAEEDRVVALTTAVSAGARWLGAGVAAAGREHERRSDGQK